MNDKQETRIKKAHITMMKNPDTALYSGVMLMGNTEVVDEDFTAYTDGVNKKYSRKFLETIKSEPQLRGLVLHENLHVALKHVTHGKSMYSESKILANMSADFVVNDVINSITSCVTGDNERLVELPDGALYDDMFHNWSMREVYNFLKKNAKMKPKPQQGKGECKNPLDGGTEDSNEPFDGNGDMVVDVNGKKYDISQSDVHDFDRDMSSEEIKELQNKVDKSLREGGMLAGRLGAKIPRVIGNLLEVKIDWRDALRDFVSSSIKGKDEFTWRKMNKRHMANDIYLPSMENETIGEVIVAIDTSGSIGEKELTEFATELASICDVCQPEMLRILWWDTEVHGEQIIKPDQYNQLRSILKPLGGGGTHVSCVSSYINKHKLNAECVIVFTDGYVEGDIKWNIIPPTLWMVTMNKGLEVPTGKKVFFDNDD